MLLLNRMVKMMKIHQGFYLILWKRKENLNENLHLPLLSWYQDKLIPARLLEIRDIDMLLLLQVITYVHSIIYPQFQIFKYLMCILNRILLNLMTMRTYLMIQISLNLCGEKLKIRH